MMPPVFSLLKNNPTVFGIVAKRIYPWGEAPQTVAYPYITYGVVNGQPQNTMDKVPQIDNLGTQIDIWAETGRECRELAEAVRDALETSAHMISITNMDRDLETKSYRYRLEFDFFTAR